MPKEVIKSREQYVDKRYAPWLAHASTRKIMKPGFISSNQLIRHMVNLIKTKITCIQKLRTEHIKAPAKPIDEAEAHSIHGLKRKTAEERGVEMKEEECKERERGILLSTKFILGLFSSSWDNMHLFRLRTNLAIPLIAIALSFLLSNFHFHFSRYM
jgi:hypothetical protein